MYTIGSKFLYLTAAIRSSAVFTLSRVCVFIAFVFVFTFVAHSANAQFWAWSAKPSASTPFLAGSYSQSWLAASDKSNNLYTALCNTNDTLVIGLETFNATLARKQMVLLKYDDTGNLVWSKASTTSASVWPISLKTDVAGNLYLYGYFSGDSARIGTTLLTKQVPALSNTAFLIKYAPDGAVIWKTYVGTISMHDARLAYGSMAVDNSGNAFITGCFTGSNVPLGGYSLSSAGNDDIFVARISNSGSVQWAKRFGGGGYEFAFGIDVNSAEGKLYVVGQFSSPTLMLGTNALNYSASVGASTYSAFNVFLAQLSAADGAVGWARQSHGDTRATSVALDKVGHIYVGGSFIDSVVSFGSSPFNGHKHDPYVIKYNNGGEVIGAHIFAHTFTPSTSGYTVWNLAVDDCNNIWVAGAMDTLLGNSITLDTAIRMPVPQDSKDPLFLACYSPEGILLDNAALPSGGARNSGLAITQGGGVYLAGSHKPLQPFVIGTDSVYTAASVFESFFVGRYIPAYSCWPTSVTAISAPVSFAAYPNPASHTLHLSCTEPIGRYSITDMLGRDIQHASTTANSVAIDVSALAPGLYLVRRGNYTVRFLKQ